MHASQSMTARLRALEHEDLVNFISAATTCTKQDEFYGDAEGQALSIRFFHDYVRGNYRRMYALCLAAGVNDANRAQIIINLLTHASEVSLDARKREGALIAASLAELPPPRAYRVLEALVDAKVNNRRARRIASDYLAARKYPELHTLKYRRRLAKIVAHFHLRMPGEQGAVLFKGKRVRRFETPLFESYRRAHFEQRAVYELPYTIAEGLAARHEIPRERFLKHIAPRLTKLERLRLQGAAERAGVEFDAFALERYPPTRQALYFLSLPQRVRAERLETCVEAMQRAARRVVRRSTFRLGRVALIADNSYSSGGSEAKRNRPLAVALAASFVLAEAAEQFSLYWTSPVESLDQLRARGHTDLADPLLAALRERPEMVVVVSDGYDNDPPGAAAELVRVFKARLDPEDEVSLVHLNPVYDAESYATRTIHPTMATWGIRDAETIPTLLSLAQFADGRSGLDELLAYLEGCAEDMLARARARAEEGSEGA